MALTGFGPRCTGGPTFRDDFHSIINGGSHGIIACIFGFSSLQITTNGAVTGERDGEGYEIFAGGYEGKGLCINAGSVNAMWIRFPDQLLWRRMSLC